ncbi:MAG: primosomal protein N' [Candidatus Zixiibacteriota bacterium]
MTHRLADVAFPVPVWREFTYVVPDTWTADPEPGDRVVAPLSGRDTKGVIVAVRRAPALPPGTRPLRRPVDPGWRLPPDLLELSRWVSEYYLCAWGEALGALAPLNVKWGAQESVFRLTRPDLSSRPGAPRRLTRRDSDLLRALSVERPTTTSSLLRRMEMSRRSLEQVLARMVARGYVSVDWRAAVPPLPRMATVQGVDAAAYDRIPLSVREFFADPDRSTPGASVAEVAARIPGGMAALRNLALDDTLLWDPIAREASPLQVGQPVSEPGRSDLNSDQAAAADRIEAMLHGGEFACALLWGPTGSGKTAVYCEAIRRVRSCGRRALFLVPEIGLASQMIRRLKVSLGGPIAVWHSGLSAVERYWMARLVARGRYPLVVGARSAVFAPIPDLGLIIVDEEHSESYKQSDPAPRYHARDVAVVRARMNRALCLLGSATPSCETYHNATSGKYVMLRLERRVRSRPLPIVRLVDLRHRPGTETDAWITPELRSALLATLQAGRKAIVFINRRGHSTMVACKRCGHSEHCPDCGLTLTYHATDRTFRCHFCTRSQPAADACPACGGTDFLFHGVGTQKIEDALTDLDPAVRLARLDADVAARRGAAAEILDGFAGDRFNLLVGTQMVAKGLDVADVGLVGVIWADQQLAFPDFRAEEKVFQLLTQVAGRAGRGESNHGRGEVLVQTFHPEHELIELAASQSAELFFTRELPRRRQLHYPPFTRLILIAFAATTQAAARAAALDLATYWHGIPDARRRTAGRLLGPAPAAIPRRADRYLVHALIKTSSTRRTAELLRQFHEDHDAAQRRTHVTMTIDVDPVDFL